MNTNYQFISFSRIDGQAVLTLNRAPLNILTIAMMEEIIDVLISLQTDRVSKVLLIRGEGKCFSAGMDVAEHLPDRVGTMLAVMRRMLEHLTALEILTVSAAHGACLGGGLELAVSADLTFAASGATLGQPEIKLAVFPPLAVACFSQLVGPKKAADMILTGRFVTAHEALDMGLVSRVFPAEDFIAHVEEVLQTIASYSRAALVTCKRALRAAVGLPVFDALSVAENIYLEETMATEDALEGLTAFLEKRAPRWRDR